VNIAGAAGSGKTTILHQIAQDLTEEDGIPPQNIIYLPLSDPRFQIGTNLIRSAVDEFASYYWQRDSGSGYVLIDDAHATSSWSEQVRDCIKKYDDLTVIVTLPTIARTDTDILESMDIESTSDLLLPSKFYDMASEFQNVNVDKPTVRSVRDGLEAAADTGHLNELRTALENVQNAIDSTSSLKRGVREYFRGEKRAASTDDARHNLELTIYRDVPRYQQFDDRSDLHALCAIAAMYPGRTIGLKNLSEILGCDRRTLQRYIDILEDFFILTPSYQYKYERRRSVRLYLRDPLLNASISDLDLTGLLSPDAEQQLMTTVVFDHLKRLGFRYQGSNAPVDFWESGDSDVDFVLETGEGTPIPIVVSSTTSGRSPSDRLRAFCNEYDCAYGLMIDRNTEPTFGEDIIELPLWLFLFVI
jgi:predicted AAA+ superfamily ATPase